MLLWFSAWQWEEQNDSGILDSKKLVRGTSSLFVYQEAGESA
jgi:hypothetical protein